MSTENEKKAKAALESHITRGILDVPPSQRSFGIDEMFIGGDIKPLSRHTEREYKEAAQQLENVRKSIVSSSVMAAKHFGLDQESFMRWMRETNAEIWHEIQRCGGLNVDGFAVGTRSDKS